METFPSVGLAAWLLAGSSKIYTHANFFIPHHPSLHKGRSEDRGKESAMGGGAGNPLPLLPAAAAEAEAFRVDRALQALGFEFTRVTAEEVVGRLAVTETCCQPFDWLHGGVSALMAEATASIGCYVASGYRRLAGVQLSINHVGPARLGDLVQARATPIQRGRKIQVWEVQIWQIDPSTSECKDLVSTARVTLLANLSTPEPDKMKRFELGLKKFSSKL